MGARTTFSYVKGIHNLKAGVVFQHTFLTERDNFGIVDPTFNPPGPDFNPLLACYDLTYTGTLPSSYGCPRPTSSLYQFHGHADVRELGMYIEDAIKIQNWTANVGLRFDVYDGLASLTQAQPRLGLAYNIKNSNTVLRVSYARTLETPFNENLVLSSVGCDDAVVNAIMSTIGPCLPSPLGPGWRNEFHAGFEQAFGRYLVVDAEYLWKYTHRAYDFSVFAATPVTFPIEWERSKIPGYAIRVSVPDYHGFTAFVVMSSVAARFFTPQIAGIGATPGGSTVFRIDHDEKFNQTTHLQYEFGKFGPWFGFNWRYDSGLVGVLCLAQAAIALTARMARILSSTSPTSRPISSSREACSAATFSPRRLCQLAPRAYAPPRNMGPSTLRFRRPARKTTITIRRASRPVVFSMSP